MAQGVPEFKYEKEKRDTEMTVFFDQHSRPDF